MSDAKPEEARWVRTGCGHQEHGESGVRRGRDMLNGVGIAHTGLADAQQRLFVADVDFDPPAPQVRLQHLLEWKSGIGADHTKSG
ncbi:MAG: hypothetical protein KA248_00610 [Kiritimatiellae bacterium]|nr:hypothetical protein [Kiritimatiellia bacterium]